MNTVEILEGMMLLSFSVSWYWSIAKMLQTKVASGKSLLFVLLICFGYVLGIWSKVVAWQQVGVLSPLVWVQASNLVVTMLDAVLVVHYSRPRYATVANAPTGPFRRQGSLQGVS